jgi:hypothetical protein
VSILPEIIFRSVLVRGIRTIRQNPKLLDQLFRNLDVESAKEMQEFFRTKAIYIDINYPRETLIVPAIVMLLRAESEAQAYLGDSMGFGQVPDEMSYDSLEDSDEAVLGGAASMSTLSGEGPIVFGPYRATSGTLNTIKVGERLWQIDQYRVGAHTLHIIGGLGVGQQRGIIANGVDVAMVKPGWSVQPDDTSVFLIRGPVTEVVGEPRSSYARENADNVERLGGIYNLAYQLQVIGPNPEFTIYLASIVKSILTLGRQFLEGQGIINMKLGATDFVPRAEYQPDFSYMRALNIEFQYPFDVFAEGDAITEIRIAIESLCCNGVVTILSDTVID